MVVHSYHPRNEEDDATYGRRQIYGSASGGQLASSYQHLNGGATLPHNLGNGQQGDQVYINGNAISHPNIYAATNTSQTDLSRYANNADRFSTNRSANVWNGNAANGNVVNGNNNNSGTMNSNYGVYSVGNHHRNSNSSSNASDDSGVNSGGTANNPNNPNLNGTQQLNLNGSHHFLNSVKGSQSALVNNPNGRSDSNFIQSILKKRNSKWPRGKDFLFTTWAFVIGAHSLWEFPILTLKYGGVVFCLVYLFVFLAMATPLILLEMTLGQYSALSPTKLYRNLCPALTGVGFGVLFVLFFVSITDLAVITWSAQALYLLFSGQELTDNFFYKRVLDLGEADLSDLGALHGQLTVCLAIVCVLVFVFISASAKSMGKVCMMVVPVCYALLMTLTIRSCMAEGGPEGLLALLTPDWSHISRPWIWLEAGRIAFASCHLGLGVISTLASFNKFNHNIIRDTGVIALGHFVWTALSVLLTFSLLGVANNSRRINIDNLRDPDGAELFVTIVGRGFWLIGVTLAETSMAPLGYNWLWSGLLFTLVALTAVTTVMCAFETIAASVVDEWPNMKRFKPAVLFTLLAIAFLVNLTFATQGGIHAYYLLTSYLTSWPTVLFGLLSVLAGAYAHGGKYLMKDLGDMSKMPLTHYVSAHLSVLYSTLIPAMLTAVLSWSLYRVSMEHTAKPLVNFSMYLPEGWGMPLGWSLATLPLVFILLGFLFHVLWQSRGMPFSLHLRRSFKPTDTWYENEHNELMQAESAQKHNQILGYNVEKNITEV